MNNDIASEEMFFTKYLVIGKRFCQFLCCVSMSKVLLCYLGIIMYIKMIKQRNFD